MALDSLLDRQAEPISGLVDDPADHFVGHLAGGLGEGGGKTDDLWQERHIGLDHLEETWVGENGPEICPLEGITLHEPGDGRGEIAANIAQPIDQLGSRQSEASRAVAVIDLAEEVVDLSILWIGERFRRSGST
jgi:hypothetical protein